MVDELEIGLDAGANGGIGEAVGQAPAVFSVVSRVTQFSPVVVILLRHIDHQTAPCAGTGRLRAILHERISSHPFAI